MMRAGHILALAAALVLFGCAAEVPPPAPPPLPQFMPAPLPPPPQYLPPPSGPRAGPSLRYRAYAKPKPHCQIRTKTTTNKAGIKRTAKYRVCLK